MHVVEIYFFVNNVPCLKTTTIRASAYVHESHCWPAAGASPHQLSDRGENRDTSDDPAPRLGNEFGHELKKCKKPTL